MQEPTLICSRSRGGLFRGAAITLALAFFASPAAAATLKIDEAHSSVSFGIRHLLSTTKGQFRKFEGTVRIDPDKRDSVKVSGSIEVASIDTGDAKRDAHLRGEDFFNVDEFPTIAFEASELTQVNDDRSAGKLGGTLTMHGVTKDIVIDVEWFGVQTDPWKNTKAGFRGELTINRKDFGIVWNKALDTGGYVLGDEVKIELELEAYVKADAEDESAD